MLAFFRKRKPLYQSGSIVYINELTLHQVARWLDDIPLDPLTHRRIMLVKNVQSDRPRGSPKKQFFYSGVILEICGKDIKFEGQISCVAEDSITPIRNLS